MSLVAHFLEQKKFFFKLVNLKMSHEEIKVEKCVREIHLNRKSNRYLNFQK